MVGGKTVTFEYNKDGIRTEKHLSGTHDIYYRLLGEKVVEMKKLSENGTERYVFIYDDSGAPYAIERYNAYSGSMSKYYYVLNIQGDVIQLVDSENNVVANYTYDAWGKLLYVTDANGNAITNALNIANVNPIRYRGYFYDTETGLYYCNSRYYDPQMKRFINADVYTSTGQGFGGYNMFAYCQNNTVGYIDSNGNRCVNVVNADFLGGKAEEISSNLRPNIDNYTIKIRDVTDEVNRALSPYVTQAKEFAKIANLLPFYEPYRYGLFCALVYHNSTWDIKRKGPWESTIGTQFPGYGVKVIYQGMLVTPENLGNYTYGVLGAAFGIPYQTLIDGSVFAAFSSGSLNGSSGFQNEIGDWNYIALGYLVACF